LLAKACNEWPKTIRLTTIEILRGMPL